jgi:nucleotide-binding universal stress UspA family protein
MLNRAVDKKVIVPVDGSESSLHALGVAIDRVGLGSASLHLLNVQLPIASGMVRMFVSQEAIDRYHAEESERALGSAKAWLERVRVPYKQIVRVGHPYEIIADYANPENNDEIIMGSRGLGMIGTLTLGSVAAKVIHIATVPVTIVK